MSLIELEKVTKRYFIFIKDKVKVKKDKKGMPKILALYLPQFHQIPENDKWWGKGFTEWVAAKNAQPLFHGHYQPRLPANDNYYDLLDKETMKWQARLAHKAGIYGFCIYHYWFGDDKLLLEKPAENLLKWKEINMRYCFSWANESWIASWSKLNGNAWLDKEIHGNENGCLMQQKYGGREEWIKHFEYLLPFFKDARYIKKDNKPVFVIYKPNGIKNLRSMTKLWNELANKNGFEGIYFIGTNDRQWKRNGMNAKLLYEPSYTMLDGKSKWFVGGSLGCIIRKMLAQQFKIYFPILIKYHAVWKAILRRKNDKNVFPGAFVDFDSTPRKGKKASISIGATPKHFSRYINRFIENYADSEFAFITAWNEWGEGAYLEPDKKYGYGYLEAIRKCIKERL